MFWCTANAGWKAGTSIVFGPLICGTCALFFDGPCVPQYRLALLRKHVVTFYCAARNLSRVVYKLHVPRDLGRCAASLPLAR